MKILLAVNGTAVSYAAVQSVADGVWPEGSEVKLLLAIEPPMALASEVAAPPDDFYMRFEKSVRDYANIVIKHAAGQLRAGKFRFRRVTADVVTGHAKFMILSEAEAWGADLIVIGARSPRGMKRPWFGSTAQAVVMHARCPVELARRTKDGGRRLKILLATDGSPCSEMAASEVAKRPWPEKSELRIISVAEAPVPIWPTPDSAPSLLIDELEQYASNRAGAAVEKAETEIRKAGGAKLKITTDVLTGSPKEKIIDEAEEWGAGLIVVGSHGFRRDRRQMIGSVSLAVASLAPCSVEVVPCRAE
jgi:nucleotide-binding universal stress UspA family protein